MASLNTPAIACNTNLPATDDGYLPAPDVLARYRVTQMTLWRWLNDDKLGFPKPLYIGRRRYFKIADLEAWEAAHADGGAA